MFVGDTFSFEVERTEVNIGSSKRMITHKLSGFIAVMKCSSFWCNKVNPVLRSLPGEVLLIPISGQ